MRHRNASDHQDIQGQIDRALTRNFFVLALNQITLRMGWILRTESVIIPGFLDHLGASGLMRGLLPTVSRVGSSFSQLLVTPTLSQLHRQKWAYITASGLLGLPWIVIGLLLLFISPPPPTMLFIFMALYSISAVGYGLSTLTFGTIQGKLIPARRRGRLLAVFGMMGGVLSLGIAAFLLPLYLTDLKASYGPIFLLCGLFFVCATLVLLGIREPPRPQRGVPPKLHGFIEDSLRIIRKDKNFRVLILVVMLMYLTLLLFPHYTVFGMRRLGVEPHGFVTLVIAQNSVFALASFFMGNLADRRGNRAMLRLVAWVAALVPLLAVTISLLPPGIGKSLYPLVYACIGFTPVSQRIVTNYTLEIAPKERHTQYLGILNVLQNIPIFSAPLVGWTIDLVSFEPVFLCFAVLMLFGALCSVWLNEPRNG